MQGARDSFTLGGTIVLPGETRHIRLPVSESYLSTPIEIPLTIINGIAEGPILLVSAASHGDECNGTAIVRELIYGVDHSNLRGVLVCSPVLNIPGFLRNERDLSDGRDLNRNFPGKPDGNSAQRMAHEIFTKIIQKCDYGVDLHTASRGRSNILQVRGDMTNNEVRRIARAFGSEIVIDELGLQGTLRRAATESGIPTITAEIGESQRFEKALVRSGLAGVMNVLYELGMLKGRPAPPLFQVIVKKTEWVRADRGGILEMIAAPRALVSEGQELCTITNPFGKEVAVVRAPFSGMVVGITNYPMVSPGFPICHLVKLDRTLATVDAALRKERQAMEKSASPGQPCAPLAAGPGPAVTAASGPETAAGSMQADGKGAPPAAISRGFSQTAPDNSGPVPHHHHPGEGNGAEEPAGYGPEAGKAAKKDKRERKDSEPVPKTAGREEGRAPPEKEGREPARQKKESPQAQENEGREPAPQKKEEGAAEEREERERTGERKDEAGEGNDNGAPSQQDRGERPSAYYEDYDEDAEPEEKE